VNQTWRTEISEVGSKQDLTKRTKFDDLYENMNMGEYSLGGCFSSVFKTRQRLAYTPSKWNSITLSKPHANGSDDQ